VPLVSFYLCVAGGGISGVGVLCSLPVCHKNDILAVQYMARAAWTHTPGAPGLKLLGLVLLLAGWGLVISALALVAEGAPRVIFVLAGIGVEIVGLVLVIRAHSWRGARE
jgi:hypothetical protein